MRIYYEYNHDTHSLTTPCPFKQPSQFNGFKTVRGGLCTSCKYYVTTNDIEYIECNFITLKDKLNLLRNLK